MFLRCNKRKKDGKVHRYYSVVENRRLANGRVAQKPILYLGEITGDQQKAWRKSLDKLNMTLPKQAPPKIYSNQYKK